MSAIKRFVCWLIGVCPKCEQGPCACITKEPGYCRVCRRLAGGISQPISEKVKTHTNYDCAYCGNFWTIKHKPTPEAP
jgi:hypothetical protein